MTPKEHHFAPFRLDAVNQCLWQGTEQISLSPKAFSVLLYLADRPGRLVTKQELLDAIWPDIHVTEGVLKRAVLEVRRALADPVDEPKFIQTLHRRGYRFLPAGNEKPPDAAAAPVDSGIVGRAREFRQLDAWFEKAVESSRQIVFVSGEAGLGKTTLVDTWMSTLRTGVALARGRCLQQFGSGEPYLPVFEALEQLSQTLGRRLVEHLRGRAPTWLMHMPALISLEDRVKLRDEVFGSTRERMLREITDALEALSAETPIVMALEDLHWSDPSTIDLLSSIARRTSPARLMILATYRPSDAGGAAAPLLVAQNELALHRQCNVMPLAYFSEGETDEYLTSRFPGMDSPDLASALHRRTNGNPLYVVCLVDELERSGTIGDDPESIRGIVPETLQQMFERQAAQLDGRVQEMLDVAAAAGESFSVGGIAAALACDPADIESQCEDLVRRNVILKRRDMFRFPDGNESPGYSFLHALCRDALYRKVPPGRRSRLHGLLALAEEKLYESDPGRIAAELAGHFELSGDVSRAIRYFRMAGDRAAARQSHQEATRYLERALGLTARLRGADQAAFRMDLLEQRASIRLSAWDLQGAVQDFDLLAEEARLAGAADRRTKALLETVHPLMIFDHRAGLAAIQTARVAQADTGDPILGAMIDLCDAFTGMYLFGWKQELAVVFQSALPSLHPVQDVRIRSRIAWMEAAVLCLSSQYAAACEKAEEGRKDSRKAGVFFEYFAATLFLNWAHFHRGNLGEAMRIVKEDAELAARNNSPLPLLWLTVREGWVRMEAFEFERPLEAYQRFAADPVIMANRRSSPLYLWLALAHLGRNNRDGAWEMLQKVPGSLDDGFPFQLALPLLHARARCALAREDAALARTYAQSLVDSAGEHHEFSYVARGNRLLARIDIQEGDLAAAAGHLSLALVALEKCEAWTVEWRIHATAAHVFSELGRHEESAESRERGLRAAQRVAATLAGEPALRQSFLEGVSRELPAARANSV